MLPGAYLSDPGVVVRHAAPVGADALSQLRGAYVLLLEDDREARRAIEDLLDDWGVIHAGGATLEELAPEVEAAGRIPDALITDFRLPGQLSGAACVQELRRLIGATVPAIIVTGESDLASVRAVMPPDTALLQKPFDEAAFVLPLLEAVVRARRAESLHIDL
ncbi:response regulator [Quisquiliibacterium transsilvanicum]|uniref:DNA-binding NtrC family response regulator n=1 Tax=Quisquiliibacterium transsilvanicum TaxID=1549638 RepID=A0A7W8MB56_9BURK|nr:response regulator [Quisquiliibacterium transsilvanicum]MBB5273809.1 DNA-binding NtrC family response regulator [Quisquiliibacterium transsilvanicum]